MLLIFALQLGVPILLVTWMVRSPPRSAVGIGMQLAGSLLLLLLLSHVGLWLFPPWWTPHAAAAILFLVTIRLLWRPDHLSVWPRGRAAMVSSGFWVVAAMLGVHGYLQAVEGRRPPAHLPVVRLSAPVAGGAFLVVNGGSAALINAHRASSDTSNARLQPWRGNGHAVDLVAINGWGLRARGLRPTDPSRYVSFGVAVLSPCDGTVLRAVDGLPDMPVPIWDREHMAGNHLLVTCAGVQVLLGHLQRHSVTVAVGDRVRTGQQLGAIGNSGGSDEPHLHIHAQLPGSAAAPFGGDPVPIRIDGRYLVRGQRLR